MDTEHEIKQIKQELQMLKSIIFTDSDISNFKRDIEKLGIDEAIKRWNLKKHLQGGKC